MTPPVEVWTHGQILELALQRFNAEHGSTSDYHATHAPAVPADPEQAVNVLMACPICEGTFLHYVDGAYQDVAPGALDPLDPTTTAQDTIRRRARALGWSWE